MKVLHLSTSDANGGAARGAFLTHTGLRRAGVNSWMLVAEKGTSDPYVLGPQTVTGSQKVLSGLRQTWEYWPLKRYPQKQGGLFSAAAYPSRVVAKIRKINPDIVHLHWVAQGLLRPEDLPQLGKPMVWTLRDMWSFTGGCHYAGDCEGYQQRCGRCPLLGSDREHDLSRQVWRRKSKAWQDVDLTIAPLSHWLADCARASSLFQHRPIQVIPNAIDTDCYRPIDQATARDLLRLPQNKQLILFGAISPTGDRRKGFQHLAPALRRLAAEPHSLEAVIFGRDRPAQPLDLGLPVNFLGYLHDQTMLALAYSAADVTVVPSEQEAFVKTAIESMACGTPVVSFDATGLKDGIDHLQNGYRAECFSPADLANGIRWVLAQRSQSLSKAARQTVLNQFTLAHQAAAYADLYRTILSRNLHSSALTK